MSKSVCDINPSLLFDESVPVTKPAISLSKSLTVKAFIDDLKLRFKKEFESAIQTWVYFYSRDDVYKETITTDYGSHNYVVFRPSLIVFVSVKDNKQILVTKTKGLNVYADFGIRFETNVPRRVWDSDKNRFSKAIMKDDDGNILYKQDKELKEETTINMLQVINSVKQFRKKVNKFTLGNEDVIEYYDWRINSVKDDSKLAKYMIQNIVHEDQFVPNDKVSISEDDAELVLE